MTGDLMFVVDSSISMGKSYSDFRPSKLAAGLDLIGKIARLRILQGWRVGLIIYFAFIVPLLPPTHDYQRLVSTLSKLGYVGEGSAMGDAIIEAVRILRALPSQRRKKIVVLSDGESNIGSPVELAALYARNTGIPVCIVVIGRRERVPLARILDWMGEAGIGEWRSVETVAEAERVLAECTG